MVDWLVTTGVKALSAVLCRVPPDVAVWCGERLGGLAYWLRPKRARIGMRNLLAAFDGQLTVGAARRIIRACCRQLGAGVLEMLRLPVMDEVYLDRYVTIEGRRYFDEAIASGRPVICLTGHYGNWELPSIFAALKGRPMVALARAQQTFPRLYRLLVSYRESKSCTIIHKGSAMRRFIAALGQGKLVGIVGDQATRRGVLVDLFGRPVPFATGAFEMAYANDGLILPGFIRRLRGPYHRLTIEAPIVLNRRVAREAAVRQGVVQFASLLERRIREDPSQWLWMHRRWKHTPARRALVLNDGKLGHLKQSRVVAETLKTKRPGLTYEVADVRYRNALARQVALFWSWWMPRPLGASRCLAWVLHPESANRILRRHADLIISCGASTVPVNVLWAAENGARSIVIMDPSPVPLRRFDLVVTPRHDQLPRRPNVIQTMGALSETDEGTLQRAVGRLREHPRYRRPEGSAPHPTVSVFIGGDTPHYDLSVAFADALTTQILAACEAMDGWCLVTTSRRTSEGVERVVAERLAKCAPCRLLLLASRDAIDGTMEGMLGAADVAVVTGESISMVSEACASGRPVIVVEPPLRHANRATLTKHQRFLRDLEHDGYVRMSLVPELSHAIRRALSEGRTGKRLDDLTPVVEAAQRLL